MTAPPSAIRSRWSTSRALFALHGWLAVVGGLLVVAVATTGALAVFRTEIDWLVTPALRVTPRGAPVVGFDVVERALARALPRGHVRLIHAPYGPRFAYVALVDLPGDDTRQVFVDPADGRVRGARAYRTHTDSVANFLRQLHVRLLMGAWGRMLVGSAGVLLLVSGVTGWVLTRRRWRALVQRPRAGRLWSSDLHRLTGLWSVAFLLVMGTSGTVLGWEGVVGQYREYYGEPAPEDDLPDALRAGPPAPPRIDAGRAVALAEQTLPGRRAGELAAYHEGPRFIYRVSLDDPGSALVAAGASTVEVDAATESLVWVTDARAAAAPGRVYDALEPLHFATFADPWGPVAGYLARAAWVALGFAPGVLIVSGAVVALRRRRLTLRAAARALRATASTRGVALGAWCAMVAASWPALRRWSPGHGTWSDALQHVIAKPLALALLGFPLTGLIAWAAARLLRLGSTGRARPLAWAAFGAALGAWHLALTLTFVVRAK